VAYPPRTPHTYSLLILQTLRPHHSNRYLSPSTTPTTSFTPLFTLLLVSSYYSLSLSVHSVYLLQKVVVPCFQLMFSEYPLRTWNEQILHSRRSFYIFLKGIRVLLLLHAIYMPLICRRFFMQFMCL
jgi:hypothetical protein